MSDLGYVPVPVHVAKDISETYGKSQVVILAYDSEYELTHTTTYGVSAADKENAAAVGEKVSKAIGCDLSQKTVFEDFHDDYDPAFLKEAVEILLTIQRRHGTTGPILQKIERFLKARGHASRQG